MPPSASALRMSARFCLPPSLGSAAARERAERLSAFLGGTLAKTVEVGVSTSYETLAKDVLAGRVDAAWAPPFVCARLEAMGVRIAVRGVRRGASSYRAALVTRADSGVTLETLAGQRAAWVDRDSTGGYLLPLALLRERGLDTPRVLASQGFHGSYRAALEAVLAGEATLASIFVPPAAVEGYDWRDALESLLPGRGGEFALLGFTDETPNDGVAVAMGTGAGMVSQLEEALLSLHTTDSGRALLTDIFSAERFEPAPRLGYRALYRVALSSL